MPPELLAEASSVRKNLRIAQIKSLAAKIKTAGISSSSPDLVRFADSLLRAAESFHVDAIQSLLAPFDSSAP